MTQTPSTPSSMAPPVFSGSNSAATGHEVGHSTSAGRLGLLVGAEDARACVDQEPQRPLERLERHVAGETVGHDHVGRAVRRSRPSTLPTKRDAGARLPSSAWVSFTRGVPLVGSSPIESRATAGLGDAVAGRGVGRAHLGELDQHRRRALGVGPGVDQHRRLRPEPGQRRGDAGPGDALEPAHAQQRRGHGGPGVARR